jgi:hypothetical protein
MGKRGRCRAVGFARLILLLRRCTENREERGVGRKRTEITIETERIIYISGRSDSSLFWCEGCARRVPMLNAEEAAALMRISIDEIIRKIEEGEFHYVQLNGGRPRICLNSLLK